MKSFIGIDLGTTNTTCTVLIQNEHGLTKSFQLPITQACFKSEGEVDFFKNEKGIIPTCVIISEKDNHIYCGSLDSSYSGLDYFPVLSFKTKLSDSLWKMKVGNTLLTSVGFSAAILYVIYDSLKTFKGGEGFIFDINSVYATIITIPASFSSKMRRATMDAAVMAGFSEKTISLLDEPVAAIMSAYNLKEKKFEKFIPDNKPMLIFDMGGGTVDASIVELNFSKKLISVKASSRYNELGGSDIDLEIASLILTKIHEVVDVHSISTILQDKHAARSFATYIIKLANELKADINLAIKELDYSIQTMSELLKRDDLPEFPIHSNKIIPGQEIKATLTLAEIIKAINSLIAFEKRNDGRNIFNPILQVWESAKMDKGKAKYNYRVGGASQFSLVYMELKKELGDISDELDAIYSVSRGASMYAYLRHIEKWGIAERTNEKIFLRRDGQPPLEILDSNIKIPSQEDHFPREILEENNTLTFDEGSARVVLEFYQGTSADDIGMSFLHRAVIDLSDVLLGEGQLTRISGSIDRNKVYRFKIEISVGGEIAEVADIQFGKSQQVSAKNRFISELSGLFINNIIYENH